MRNRMGTVSFSLLSMNTPESILHSSYYSKLIHVHATAVVQTFKYKYAIGGVTSQFAYTSISCKRRKKKQKLYLCFRDRIPECDSTVRPAILCYCSARVLIYSRKVLCLNLFILLTDSRERLSLLVSARIIS